jgi:ABC-type methionine transport system ATPase subunit
MELFQEIHVATGITIVLVTHTGQLIRYGTRAITMAEGRVVENQSVKEVSSKR